VACAPAALAGLLGAVTDARRAVPSETAARVLPAHLESNFINPDYRGAQPAGCLRLPPPTAAPREVQRARSAPRPSPAAAPPAAFPVRGDRPSTSNGSGDDDGACGYTSEDILDAIDASAGATGIVTLAPELPGGLALIEALTARGIQVSLGHSGATCDEAAAAFAAGARRVTHLFNRMPPLHHRHPGLAGAVLDHEDVDAELICDGFHVHPTMARLAVRLKSAGHVLAITDGTAGAGLHVGSRARLGGQPITVTDTAAFLADGTLAGSTLTMDRAFRTIVTRFGCTLADAVAMCAANPARTCGLRDQGVLRPGALADFVVMTPSLQVVETWIGGRRAWPRA
jgi:N-acetylglucosamine-6-phosphate deacetylase